MQISNVLFSFKVRISTKICLGWTFGVVFLRLYNSSDSFFQKISQVIDFAIYFLMLHFSLLGNYYIHIGQFIFCVYHSLQNLSLGASSCLHVCGAFPFLALSFSHSDFSMVFINFISNLFPSFSDSVLCYFFLTASRNLFILF